MVLIRYQTLRIQDPLVDMSLHLMEQLCHGSFIRRCALQDVRWNHSLLFLIKL